MRTSRVTLEVSACALAVTISLSTACRRATEIDVPAINLHSIEVHTLSGGVADVHLELEVNNINDFDVTLVGIAAGLTLNEAEVGPANWSGEFRCPKEQSSMLRVPLRLTVGEHQEIFNSLIDRHPPLRHAMRGEVTFAHGVIRRTFPLAADGEIGSSSNQ